MASRGQPHHLLPLKCAPKGESDSLPWNPGILENQLKIHPALTQHFPPSFSKMFTVGGKSLATIACGSRNTAFGWGTWLTGYISSPPTLPHTVPQLKNATVHVLGHSNTHTQAILSHHTRLPRKLVVLLAFGHRVVASSLWPHRLWHARPPCPSPPPRVCPSSCSLCQWCHPAVASSDALWVVTTGK